MPRLYEGRDSRLSYVSWQERLPPLIVVELLSPGTEKDDLGQTGRDASEPPTKWEVYEQILRVPYYAVFSRESTELRIFQLNGSRYAEVTSDDRHLWIPEADLGLGLWYGSYNRQERLWLRWFDTERNWIPTRDEIAEHERSEKNAALLREAQLLHRAEHAEALTEQERQRGEQERQRAQQEQQRAEEEHQRAEQERGRAERLAEMLRQLGQDPDNI